MHVTFILYQNNTVYFVCGYELYKVIMGTTVFWLFLDSH